MLENIFDNCRLVEIARSGSAVYLGFEKHSNMENCETFEDIEMWDYEMFIESSVRISGNNRVLLAGGDIFSVLDSCAQIGEDDEDVWDIYGNNEFDVKLEEDISKILPLKVLKATFYEIGDIEIELENGIYVNVFSNINVPFGMENWIVNDNICNKQYIFENHELTQEG